MADEFTINEGYAEKYNKWREKEELQKLKDKYGPNAELELELAVQSSGSSSESEDEDAEGLTPQLEKDWLRTLAAIKSKNPNIYKKDVEFYHNKASSSSDSDSDEDKHKKEQKKKEKPMFLKDYERKVVLEKGGRLSEESEDEEERVNEYNRKGYFEEQEDIRDSFKKALDSDEDDGEWLTNRKKTNEDKAKEEAEYLEWLKGQKDELTQDKQAGIELDPLKNYWSDPKLDAGEKFLRDYILNKQYLDDDDKDRVPTYDEIVNEENVSEDEAILEKQEDFERKYNFRFEEPDPEFIKSYPRTLAETVRRKDDRRALKRQEAKERKEKEKDKKREELKQLKKKKVPTATLR